MIEWLWAALIMAGFVALTALTMWLVRLPLRRRPPPREGSEVGGGGAGPDS